MVVPLDIQCINYTCLSPRSTFRLSNQYMRFFRYAADLALYFPRRVRFCSLDEVTLGEGAGERKRDKKGGGGDGDHTGENEETNKKSFFSSKNYLK